MTLIDRHVFYRVKDCGLHNQKMDVIIIFACLVGWLDSSPVEIKKLSLKKLLGLMLVDVNTSMPSSGTHNGKPTLLVHCLY